MRDLFLISQIVFYWILYVFCMDIFLWGMFRRMGVKTWHAIIPVYKYYVLCKFTYGNGWLFLLLFVPIVNIVFYFKGSIDFVKLFGKSTKFGVLNAIFTPATLAWLAYAE